jgi:hypothetical protein
MLYSEFRDGNVPAGHEQLRVLKQSLRHLPDSVRTVSLRSDTAGYQEELLLCCGEGKDPRFGAIEFAIGASPPKTRTIGRATAGLVSRAPRIQFVVFSPSTALQLGPAWPPWPRQARSRSVPDCTHILRKDCTNSCTKP